MVKLSEEDLGALLSLLNSVLAEDDIQGDNVRLTSEMIELVEELIELRHFFS